ncbi:MAG TPA: lysylphosphatidylglycerol synthase transmembrane domain-containing protein, partial [Gemmatimonadaceae bacterium]|nr:lysylphosphatidylglycerol synthase transmembrane domain-containing protein [Gemmatimonadaceae bacterium]
MKKKLGGVLRVLVLVIIIGALVLFARTVNWSETWAAIRQTSPGVLALAAAVNILSLVLKGVRWWIFLRAIGVSSLWLAMRATFAGAGLNNILVAQGGEAARVIFVARAAHVPSERVLATLALERLFEAVGYVILLAAAATFLSLPASLQRARPFALGALVLVIVLLVYLVRHPEKAELPSVTGEGLLHRAKTYGKSFLRTLTSISSASSFAW